MSSSHPIVVVHSYTFNRTMVDQSNCTIAERSLGLTRSYSALSKVIILMIIITFIAVMACTTRELSSNDRAFALDRELMCPVCAGQTIDQSNARIATDMRRLLREQIASGDSDKEIKDYFVERYGNAVLSTPPAHGFSLVSWVIAMSIALGGMVILIFVMRSMRYSRKPDSDMVETEADLIRHLRMVDRDIDVFMNPRPPIRSSSAQSNKNNDVRSG